VRAKCVDGFGDAGADLVRQLLELGFVEPAPS
jgi:hypothetical protein